MRRKRLNQSARLKQNKNREKKTSDGLSSGLLLIGSLAALFIGGVLSSEEILTVTEEKNTEITEDADFEIVEPLKQLPSSNG